MSKQRKMSFNDFREGGIAAAEHNGLNREKIMKEMYRHTDGMDTDKRRELVSEFFDRSKG